MYVTQISHYITLYTVFGIVRGRSWDVLPADKGVHLYFKNVTDQYVEEIVTEMEEIIWTGIKYKIALSIMLCVGYLYCATVNSKWFNVCFVRDLNEEINMLREKYSNAECLIIADFNCRIGKRQVELPNLSDVWENWMLKAKILAIKDVARIKTVLQKERSWYVFVKQTI